jgi:HAD superfamily hydrolase (TIGR01509 family)
VITTVLFDLGNTLIDYHAGPTSDEDKDLHGLQAMANRLAAWGQLISAEELEHGFYRPWVEGFPQRKDRSNEYDVRELLRKLLPEGCLTPERFKQLLLDFHVPTAEEAVASPGARNVLSGLHGAGIQIGLVSNSPIPGFCHDYTLERLGLLEFFDFRIYSYDEGMRKPDQKIFERALSFADATPDQCLMVGDSWDLDLERPLQMGIHTLAYRSKKLKHISPRAVEKMDLDRFVGEISSVGEIARFVACDGQPVIRRARPDDACGIHMAHMRSILETCAKDYSEEQISAWGRRRYNAEERLRTIQEDLIWVVEFKNVIHGYGHVAVSKGTGGRCVDIDALYLTPDVAGRGIGRTLMTAMEAAARNLGSCEIELLSTRSALSFYKRIGYEQVGSETQVRIGGVPIPCFVLKKRLSEPGCPAH